MAGGITVKNWFIFCLALEPLLPRYQSTGCGRVEEGRIFLINLLAVFVPVVMRHSLG